MSTKKQESNKTSNDPIADFLTRIRNSVMVNKKTVQIPYSKLKHQLATLLQDEGYISFVDVVNEDQVSKKSLELGLKYTPGSNKSVISGLKKVSTPGLRKYFKAKYAPRVLNGLGISIFTTSQGLRTDRAARKEKVGGELLCQVW